MYHYIGRWKPWTLGPFFGVFLSVQSFDKQSFSSIYLYVETGVAMNWKVEIISGVSQFLFLSVVWVFDAFNCQCFVAIKQKFPEIWDLSRFRSQSLVEISPHFPSGLFLAETGAAINRKLEEIWDGLLGTPTISTSLITLRKSRLFFQKYCSPLCVTLTDFSRFVFWVREDQRWDMKDLCLFVS